jgi:hypothetical protein
MVFPVVKSAATAFRELQKVIRHVVQISQLLQKDGACLAYGDAGSQNDFCSCGGVR